jgi:hypothetical protein
MTHSPRSAEKDIVCGNYVRPDANEFRLGIEFGG